MSAQIQFVVGASQPPWVPGSIVCPLKAHLHPNTPTPKPNIPSLLFPQTNLGTCTAPAQHEEEWNLVESEGRRSGKGLAEAGLKGFSPQSALWAGPRQGHTGTCAYGRGVDGEEKLPTSAASVASGNHVLKRQTTKPLLALLITSSEKSLAHFCMKLWGFSNIGVVMLSSKLQCRESSNPWRDSDHKYFQ